MRDAYRNRPHTRAALLRSALPCPSSEQRIFDLLIQTRRRDAGRPAMVRAGPDRPMVRLVVHQSWAAPTSSEFSEFENLVFLRRMSLRRFDTFGEAKKTPFLFSYETVGVQPKCPPVPSFLQQRPLYRCWSQCLLGRTLSWYCAVRGAAMRSSGARKCCVGDQSHSGAAR